VIVAVLLAIIGDNVGPARQSLRSVFAIPAACCVALAGFLAVYYLAHAMLFGTQIL